MKFATALLQVPLALLLCTTSASERQKSDRWSAGHPESDEGPGKFFEDDDTEASDSFNSQTAMMAAGAGSGGAAAMGNGGKYFQDFYTLQLGPQELEFGHVCEDPNEWEQRFERKDLANQHHVGQVRWGDKHGGYGEHYWDYNHGDHHGGQSDGEGQGSDPVGLAEPHPVVDAAAPAPSTAWRGNEKQHRRVPGGPSVRDVPETRRSGAAAVAAGTPWRHSTSGGSSSTSGAEGAAGAHPQPPAYAYRPPNHQPGGF